MRFGKTILTQFLNTKQKLLINLKENSSSKSTLNFKYQLTKCNIKMENLDDLGEENNDLENLTLDQNYNESDLEEEETNDDSENNNSGEDIIKTGE